MTSPIINLQPGSTGNEVKKLQDFLVSQGVMSRQQVNTGYGIYGPQTKAAVAQWQAKNNVQAGTNAGYWGPKSIAAAQIAPTVKAPNDPSYKYRTDVANTLNTNYKPGTVPPTDAEVHSEMTNNPVTSGIVTKYGTWEDALKASGGDITKLTDQYGTPFSQADQQAALKEASSALSPYYAAETAKDTADTEAKLAAQQQAYQDYTTKAGQEFQTEKTTQDQTAANQGVLFSGGRAQKLQNLKNAYEAEGASKLAGLTSDVGQTARDYQYAYGNTNAQNPNLSKYYTAGSNVYNPNVATGGVEKGGLSTMYNPSSLNFQGTNINAANAAKQARAAGLLWNKANKLTGSNTIY